MTKYFLRRFQALLRMPPWLWQP